MYQLTAEDNILQEHCSSRNVTSQTDGTVLDLVLYCPSNLPSSPAYWCRLFPSDIPKAKDSKSGVFRSHDLGGQVRAAQREMMLLPNIPCRISMVSLAMWQVVPSCWNHSSWRLRRWITTGLTNVLTVSVKTSAFSKKRGPHFTLTWPNLAELGRYERQYKTRDMCHQSSVTLRSVMNYALVRLRSCIAVEGQHLRDIFFRS